MKKEIFSPISDHLFSFDYVINALVQFSRSVMSNCLQHHEPQHARPPCPSPTPGVYPNPCPLSWWCHPTISSSVIPFSSCPSIFPNIRVFSNESALHIRWPKYWSFSFSISPSNGYSGLISFRIWFGVILRLRLVWFPWSSKDSQEYSWLGETLLDLRKKF